MNPIWLDSTRIGDLARCSTRALGRHRHGRCGETSIPLAFGSAWHKALEWWGAGKPLEEALEAFRAAWPGDTPVDQYGGRTRENGEALLRAWYLQRPVDELFVSITDCELQLETTLLTLDGPVDLIGRVDALARSKVDGRVWGVEYKTTGRLDSIWVRRWAYSHQITTYSALVEAHTGEACAGILVLGVETKPVPSSNRACKEHGVKYEECGLRHVNTQIVPCSRTPAQIRQWVDIEVLRYAAKWADLCKTFPVENDLAEAPVEGMANLSCDYCDLLLYCQSGKSLRVLQSFDQRFWDPRNPSE